MEPISFSELKTYARCRRLWKYVYVDGWQPRVENPHLVRGRWIHELLAAYYLKQPWEEVHERLLAESIELALLQEEVDAIRERADFFKAIMERYVRHYKDEVWEPVEYEGAPLVEREITVHWPFPYLTIKVDLVARDGDGQIWVWDHKTRLEFDSQMELELDYDLQLSLYILGLRSVGIPVVGGLHNYIRMRLPTRPRVNQDGSLSKARIITDEETVLETIAQTGARISDEELAEYLARLPKDAFFRRYATVRTDDELRAVFDEVAAWSVDRENTRVYEVYPRTLTKFCTRCPFFRPCITALKGGDEGVILREFYVRSGERPVELYDEGGDVL